MKMTLNLPASGLFFLCAVCLYSLFSYPTPHSVGGVELSIIALILMALLSVKISSASAPEEKEQNFIKISAYLLCAMLLFALIRGVASGHSIEWIIRDSIAFSFLFLPYFLLHADKKQQWGKVIFGSLLIAGTFFALRRILVVFSPDFLPLNISPSASNAEILSLSVTPEILFSGVFSAVFAICLFCQKTKQNHKISYLIMLALACIGALCLMVVTLSIMRAALGVFCIAVFIAFYWGVKESKGRASVLLAVFIVLGILFLPLLQQIATLFIEKNISLGMNARGEEFKQIMLMLSDGSFSLLLGLGLGQGLENPAVGGGHVNFTHGALTAFLLKTGLLGSFLFALYMVAIFLRLYKLCTFNDAVSFSITLALGLSLLVNIFLYGGYKSLGFGMLLSLAVLLPINISLKKPE